MAERPFRAPACKSEEREMAQPFSEETQVLLEAADRAIARSHDLRQQRQEIVAECERRRRVRKLDLLFSARSGN